MTSPLRLVGRHNPDLLPDVSPKSHLTIYIRGKKSSHTKSFTLDKLTKHWNFMVLEGVKDTPNQRNVYSQDDLSGL